MLSLKLTKTHQKKKFTYDNNLADLSIFLPTKYKNTITQKNMGMRKTISTHFP